MNSLLIASIVFVCVFGGAMAGTLLHVKLPENHRDGDSRDVIKLVMGLIATIAALVLGLLIASAHTAYDTQESEVRQLAVHLALLDRILAGYGPEAADARSMLREIVVADVDRIWPNSGPGTAGLPTKRGPRAGRGPVRKDRPAQARFRGPEVHAAPRVAAADGHGQHTPADGRAGRRLAVVAVLRRPGVLAGRAVPGVRVVRALQRDHLRGLLRRRAVGRAARSSSSWK